MREVVEGSRAGQRGVVQGGTGWWHSTPVCGRGKTQSVQPSSFRPSPNPSPLDPGIQKPTLFSQTQVSRLYPSSFRPMDSAQPSSLRPRVPEPSSLRPRCPDPSPPPSDPEPSPSDPGFHSLSFSSWKVQIPSLPQIQESRCYLSTLRPRSLGPSLLPSDSHPPPSDLGFQTPALLPQPQG